MVLGNQRINQGAKVLSLKKNFALSSAYQVLLLASPFVTAPYVSRVLGADGIGIYSYTRSIQMYFSLFATLGTASYGAREIARERDSAENRSKLFWEIEILSVFTSLVCLAFWFLFVCFFSKEYKIFFLIFTLNILAVMMDISWFYTGLEQFKYTVGINSFFRILGIVLQFLLIKRHDDLWVYIAIMALTNFLGNLSMWIPLNLFLVKVELRSLKILPHLKETIVYFIPAVSTSLYTLLDKVLIGFLTRSPEQNGYYEQATQIENAGKTLAFVSLNSVVGSRISYLYKSHRIEEIKERIKTSIKYILFMGCAVAFGIASCAPTFVPWFFGAEYKGAVPLLQMMIPLVVVIGISGCLGSHYYTPSGKRLKSAMFILTGAVVNIVLSVLLIPCFKAAGAVIGSFSAEVLITSLYVANCDGVMTFRKLFMSGWKNLASGLVMFCLIFLLNRWNVFELLRLFVQVVLGMSVYILLLFFMKDEFVLDVFRTFIKKVFNRGGVR